MSYWIKQFADGSMEQGTDEDVMRGRASWTKGRLKDMSCAILHFCGTIIKVAGSHIWQKDQFVSGIGPYPPTRIARSLGVQITEREVGQCAYLEDAGSHVYTLAFAPMAKGKHVRLTKDDINSWVVIKISQSGTVGLFIEERYRV